ncbi:hypothetical protein VNO77_15885 [Canavalia gladiata]|uniref:Uncharacterized protein n=1 Tax=Canavalia gladiata TaxID=3824 RepID=A0AAN9LZG5_CANGL
MQTMEKESQKENTPARAFAIAAISGYRSATTFSKSKEFIFLKLQNYEIQEVSSPPEPLVLDSSLSVSDSLEILEMETEAEAERGSLALVSLVWMRRKMEEEDRSNCL